MRILLWILIVCYGLASFKAVGPYLNYYLNQDYIAEELCENKDQPLLECNGKCQLTKELQQLEQDSQDETNQSNSKSVQKSWVHISPKILYIPEMFSKSLDLPLYTNNNPKEVFEEIFTPPPIV